MKNYTICIICGSLIWCCSDSGTNNNDSETTYSVDYRVVLYGGTTDSIGFDYKLRESDGNYLAGFYLLNGPFHPDFDFRWGRGYYGFKKGNSLYFEVEVFPYCSNYPCT